jgi:molybdate transport system permease protein
MAGVATSDAERSVTPAQDCSIRPAPSDTAFVAAFAVLGGSYVALIAAMLIADTAYTSPAHLWKALASPEIQYALKLSLFTCFVSTSLSMFAAVPLGYLMSRHTFFGKGLVDALIDIPVVLPPLVIGLSLLILMQTAPGRFIERYVPITYAVPSVILAQFAVSTAFAVRTMRVTFDGINPRYERIALTLGCSRFQAFRRVVLPMARRGMLAAATLAWARALGEFGPILIFSGATRMRTEVLSTTVFLELSIGNLDAAVAVSMLMIAAAAAVLFVMRAVGADTRGASV